MHPVNSLNEPTMKDRRKILAERQAQTLAAIIAELRRSITMCVEASSFLAAQMLMYAGIDIMGSFDRPKTKVEGDQQEFKRWAKKYVLDPNPHLRVTADDLYGGRCGLIHAAIVESGKSRRGEARLIFPVLRPAPIEPFQETLDQIRRDDPTYPIVVAVYLDDLLRAFMDGLEKYREDVESSPQKKALVTERAGKVPIYCRMDFLYGGKLP